MRFDELLVNHIGELGKYQILILIILCYEEVQEAVQVMNPIFTAATPHQYWCKHSQLDNDTVFGNLSLAERLRLTIPPGSGNDINDDDNLSKCLVYDVTFEPASYLAWTTPTVPANEMTRLILNESTTKECTSGWIFDRSVFTSTMVTEWSLVCTGANTAIAKSLAAVFLGGRAVGNFIFGWITDRYGRRKVFLWTGLGSVCVALSTAVVPTYEPYLCLRFIQGVLATAKTSASFIMAMEYVGTSRRTLVGCIYFVFWAVGMCILAGIAYCIRDWRHLLFALTVPEFFLYIIAYFCLPESPRWLYMKGRSNEADKIIRIMAKTNGVTLPEDIEITEQVEKLSVSPLDLVRKPEIRITSLILSLVWFSTGLTYYGLNFTTGNLGGNVFLNTLITGLVEIPAYLSIILVFVYAGRIIPLSGSMLLGAFGILASMALQDSMEYHWLFIGLVMLGKLSITAAFSMLWLYCGECYPTCIRSLGLNMTSITARIASPIGPFIILLATVHIYLPSIVYATFAIVTGVMILYLPETRRHHLVQTIEEGEQFIKHNRLNICRRRKTATTTNSKEGYALTSADDVTI